MPYHAYGLHIFFYQEVVSLGYAQFCFRSSLILQVNEQKPIFRDQLCYVAVIQFIAAIYIYILTYSLYYVSVLLENNGQGGRGKVHKE